MFDNTEKASKSLVPRQSAAGVCASVEPWLGLTGLNWRPATYDEVIEQQYPNCLDILDNPHIKSKRQKELMAEVTNVVLQSEGSLTAKDFGNFGLPQGELLTRGLFYVGSAYDKNYRIVPFGSGNLHMPPLLATNQEGDFFPASRASHTFVFSRSKALEAIREQVLSGALTCAALTAAVSRMKARGDL